MYLYIVLRRGRTSFNPLEGIDERKITCTGKYCYSCLLCLHACFLTPSKGSDTSCLVCFLHSRWSFLTLSHIQTKKETQNLHAHSEFTIK